MVNGRGDTPNQHDILTGTNAGRHRELPQTCNDWTNNGDGSAMVGHHDRHGPATTTRRRSPGTRRTRRAAAARRALQGTGGDGLLYCFAVN